ncbi:twin-arginine translocase subunit TatC [Streptomyces sp. JJ36]|uniref:twin-arginine translocase subunit TatC n=1 Tax=Streptomyces sp. JJ36 TaxID=2736645 RepID=UPI001F00CFB9|nr:twin-arginine translocase subunit TatC [Streptomyces sp. JJ36]MCF6523205.1 twin-arginine translocase subunit TatC [Streptomyces sp. JJ36]
MLKSARTKGKKPPRDPEGRMPLAEHLRELRNRLTKAVLAILAVTIGCAFFYKDIVSFLVEPLLSSVGCENGTGRTDTGEACAVLTVDGLLGPFTIALKVSLMSGLVIATPVWLYQLWAFLAPGLHQHERKYALWFVGAGAPLFVGGAVLAYKIMPQTAQVLLQFTPEDAQNLLRVDDYLDIVTRMVVVFGLAFELPLILVMLNLSGVLSGKRMLHWWRAMVLGIAVFAAVATPGGEPLTMITLTAPIVLLYFAAVGFSLLNDRRRNRRDPYAGLDDDEASVLDHTPEAVGAAEALPSAGEADGDGARRRDGFDDAT